MPVLITATSDFQSAYPDLYNDFCDALPVPDYTRRDGVLNLYSHVSFDRVESLLISLRQFPLGPTRPDIGPKMYNAFVCATDSSISQAHMRVTFRLAMNRLKDLARKSPISSRDLD